jgi:hypothetical protein
MPRSAALSRSPASCSTALRIDASGLRISCASDAPSSATACSRSARRISSSICFAVRDVLDHRRHPRHALPLQHRRAHAQVAVPPARPLPDLEPADRHAASPPCGGSACPAPAPPVQLVQHRPPRPLRQRQPSSSAAAAFMCTSRPAPSTVTSAVSMAASISFVSSRSCRSSDSTAPSAVPVRRSRSPTAAVATATTTNSPPAGTPTSPARAGVEHHVRQ